MKIREACQIANEILKNKGIQSFALDTRLLLAHLLGKDTLFVLTNPDYEIGKADGFLDLVKRRENYEPVQYIIGKAEFMSLEFEVNRHTLIPRPDTETLAQLVINAIGGKPSVFLDIGTGSGCIAVSILKYCPNATGIAADVSQKALDTAYKNAAGNNVATRLSFLNIDILKDFPQGEFDIIVSNPPYIETEEIDRLEDNVKNYEPKSALDGGADGLVFYKRISWAAKKHLKNGGFLCFEAGHTQSRQISEILKKDGYSDISVFNDLAGVPRVISARYYFLSPEVPSKA